MFCSKCGNEMKDGENFCSKCGNKVETKENKQESKNNIKEPATKSKKGLIIGIVVTVIAILCIILFVIFTTRDKNEEPFGKLEEIGSNNQVTKTSKLSFSNMKAGNKELELNQTQYEVLKYFDNNYFNVYNCEDLQRYPKVYKGAQIRIDCWIKKIIKSTEDEFVCLGVIGSGGEGINEGELSDFEEKDLFVVKGKQLDERLIVDDEITVYGTYTDVSSFEIDGRTYTVPVIESLYSYNVQDYRFDLSTITKVAKYIFGDNIKITRPADTQAYGYDASSPMYIISLDNQSNANFKEFCAMQETGYIGYTSGGYGESVNKRLLIAADFQHYIVETFEPSTKHLYIDYYDKDLNKVWGREFDYKMNSSDLYSTPTDYTDSQMALVVDNDLYLLNLKNGENVFDPVLVGEKIKLTMLSDRMMLLGNENKDAIMYVDYKGNIIKKMNADTEMDSIYAADTQIVNNRMVVMLYGEKEGYSDYGYRQPTYLTKYIVLNSNGEIEMSTKETNSF